MSSNTQPINRLAGDNPLSYMGVDPSTPPELTTQSFNPTVNDSNFNIGTFWTTRDPAPDTIWMLADLNQGQATWAQLYPASGSTPIQFVTNSGTATVSMNVLNVLGTGLLSTTGSINTITASLTNGSNGQVIIGGGAGPAWANLIAGSNITISNGANSITIASSASEGANDFVTNTGTAMGSGGIISILGGNIITTTGSGSTVTVKATNGSNGQLIIGGGANPMWASVIAGSGITLTTGANSLTIASSSGASSFVTNSGTATQSGGTLHVAGANVITTTGSGSTITVEATNGTNGQLIIGGGANPAWASVIAGSGITLSTGPNSLSIATSASGVSGLVFLGKQTVSSVTNMSFTSLMSPTYNTYLLQGVNITTTDTLGGIMDTVLSSNNGSSYYTSGYYAQSGAVPALITARMPLEIGDTLSFDALLFNATSGAGYIQWLSRTQNVQPPSGTAIFTNTGGWGSSTVINAIKVIVESTGHFSGTFYLYGYTH